MVDDARGGLEKNYLSGSARAAAALQASGRIVIVVAVPRAPSDNQLLGIDQQRSTAAGGGTEIGAAAESERGLAGDLREAAVAAGGTTTGSDAPEKIRALVGPDDDAAAVAGADGIGADICLGVDPRQPRIGDGRVGTLMVTTQQHRAAAQISGHVDARGVAHHHRVAEHLHRAAAAFGCKRRGLATGVEQRESAALDAHLAAPAPRRVRVNPTCLHDARVAPQGHRAGLTVCQRRHVDGAGVREAATDRRKSHRTRAAIDADGADDALVVDRPVEDAAGNGGAQKHLATVGAYLAAVGNRTSVAAHVPQQRAVDLEADQAVAVEIHQRLTTGAQCDMTEIGDDDALVAHCATEQGDATAGGGTDEAAIGDKTRLGSLGRSETVVAAHEVVDLDIQARSHQRAHLDPRAGTEYDAVGIHYEDATVGLETTVDLARQLIEDAVEGRRRGRRLLELDALVGGHVEACPVEGQCLGLLLDERGAGVGALNAAAACHHLPAAGAGGDRAGNRHQQQQYADDTDARDGRPRQPPAAGVWHRSVQHSAYPGARGCPRHPSPRHC